MYLGLDIGGTNLKVGLINSANELMYQYSQKSESDLQKNHLLEQIIALIKNTIFKYPKIKTLGIGVPGVVNNDIVKIAPNLKGWVNIALKQIISKQINIPIAIDNDANVAAIAEMELGSAIDLNDFIYLTLGTGVGGTIVFKRTIFRGSNGGAGELGHTIINYQEDNPDNLPSYRLGVLEEYIGRKQIISIAKELIKEYPETILDSNNLDVMDISGGVNRNDKASIKCFNEVGHYLGVALASVMNLLDISTVIIGGGISKSHHLLFDKTLETIKLRAIPTIAERAELKLARFNKDAGIIGAALIGKKLIKE